MEDLATAEFHHVPDADCLFDLGFGNFVFRRSGRTWPRTITRVAAGGRMRGFLRISVFRLTIQCMAHAASSRADVILNLWPIVAI